MTSAPRIVAVVPFGARAERPPGGRDERPGAWARQIARRVVERLEPEPGLDVRPVFVVAVPPEETETGYLVFGSTPDMATAARYGASAGADFVLTGTYAEASGERSLAADLVKVDSGSAVASFSQAIPPGRLAEAEVRLAAWLTERLGLTPGPGDPDGDEAAYAALLEGMDAEMDAALLRSGDPAAAEAAQRRAGQRFAEAVRADPTGALGRDAEDRILVGAARSLEHGAVEPHVEALEALIEAAPRSWRAHYLLGELRQAAGDLSSAVVAFEHADAVRPLSDEDSLRLAELYARLDAPGSAAARLRRIAAGTPGPATARARRLLLALRDPDRERALETAGAIALGGETARFAEARALLADVLGAHPDVWEAHFALGLLAREEGDPEEAVRAFRAALERWPDQPEAMHELGLALADSRRRAEEAGR